MTGSSESATAQAASKTAWPQAAEDAKLKRAQLIDRIGRHVITFAGVLVLINVGLILFFLLSQALPLVFQPQVYSLEVLRVKSGAEAQAKITELNALGLPHVHVVEVGESEYGVLVGRFDSRSEVEQYRANKKDVGILTGAGIVQHDLHAAATLPKMLLPQQYEGYKQPEYIWQTEASEGAEEKFGVPLLIWGTLKGAIWAMFFSVPLALLSAIFVAEFASRNARMAIKSSIEILAGVPTVIIGFFAFVVLSTAMNSFYMNNTFYFSSGQWVIAIVQVLFFLGLASYLGGRISLLEKPAAVRALLIVLALFASAGIAYVIGPPLEFLVGSSLKPIFGVQKFMQLNGLLAGFCLGFAIVPVIFSVAEDALKAVPGSYREASLALGASKWETALRVVVPSAAPGVYAAVMLGLARAVGETMIVLMASGNTAIMDLSAFTGMRTMSAAIAIEASEKAQYSTGYHVLFFVGALLFLITFALNVVTDQLIHRLKNRYKAT